MVNKKEVTKNKKLESTPKRDRFKELQEHPFDKKMLHFVADEMKNWIDFAFAPEQDRIRIAAIVVKACQEYEKSKINSSNTLEQADAIMAMANQLNIKN